MCGPDEGVDICPSCFCAGKEFKQHKRSHAYRVIVRDSLQQAMLCIADGCRKSIRTQFSVKIGERTSKIPVPIICMYSATFQGTVITNRHFKSWPWELEENRGAHWNPNKGGG